MKKEELLRRKAAEENTLYALSHHWPWLVPSHNPDGEIVTLFEGWIREDGTVIPIEPDARVISPFLQR